MRGDATPEMERVYERVYPEQVGVARALYANASEYPDELAFAEGDHLRVLHDRIGPELSAGWWLCEDATGKRGIVPANRLEVMRRFDEGFFQVASPLFDDFFMFHNNTSPSGGRAPFAAAASPFGAHSIADRRRRLFSGFGDGFFDDPIFGAGGGSPQTGGSLFDSSLQPAASAASSSASPHPIRRHATTDDALHGVIRNIPIRVEQRESAPDPARIRSDFDQPQQQAHAPRRLSEGIFSHPVRRTVSSGQLSPPPSPAPTTTSTVTRSSGPGSDNPSSSAAAIRRLATGNDVEFSSASPVERLAQRLRNLASSKPYAASSPSPSITDSINSAAWPATRSSGDSVRPYSESSSNSRNSGPNYPNAGPTPTGLGVTTRAVERSPSPSSSGICTDIGETSPGRTVDDNDEANKRSSDLSSLSGGSATSASSDASPDASGADENDSGTGGDADGGGGGGSDTTLGRPRSLPRGYSATLSHVLRSPPPAVSAVAPSDRFSKSSSSGSQPGSNRSSAISTTSSTATALPPSADPDRTPTGREMSGAHSMPTLPVPTPTSALQSVFDSIERPALRRIPVVVSEYARRPSSSSPSSGISTNGAASSVPFGEQSSAAPSGRVPSLSEWSLPASIAEDMRKNASPAWQSVPIARPTNQQQSNASNGQRSISSISNDEMQSRKRVLCTRMQDFLHAIECSIEALNQATVARGWREPHVLQRHLPTLREAVATIHESIDNFVDSTARVAVESSSPKADELRALLLPLDESRSMVGTLRRALDHSGWTLASLARDKTQPRTGFDAIEQFLILVKRLPQDCRNLLDWLRLLSPAPPAVVFISTVEGSNGTRQPTSSASFSSSAPPPARVVPIQQKATTNGGSSAHNGSIGNAPSPTAPTQSDDSKRLSSSSTSSTVTSGGDSGSSSSNSLKGSSGGKTPTGPPPSSILKQSAPSSSSASSLHGAPRNQRVTFADECTDDRRGNASSAPASSSAPSSSAPSSSAPPPFACESRILEEDDLESVISERDSLYQDYASLDDDVTSAASAAAAAALQKRRAGGYGNAFPTPAGSSSRRPVTVGPLSDEDRQLIRFYAPQLASHTDALALAIDDFIDVIEHQLPPRDFVQKGKLIILAAHKLIYIGDAVSQCVSSSRLSNEVRSSADRLCTLLKDCVAATKTAADDYPNVSCVQRMVDSIVSVSQAATELKLILDAHS